MKRLLFLALLMMPVSALWAQDTIANPKQKISEVKQAEGQYLYADKTSGSVEEALAQAQELLLREVMEFLQQSGEDIDDVAAFMKEQMVTITVQRGDKFRAFVYIDKRQHPEVKTIHEQVAIEEETVVAEETKTQETPAVANTEEPVEVAQSADPMLHQIAKMTTRLQVYDYITQLQKEGEKVTFSSHPEASELEKMYVLLYKRGGAIEAILTPPDEKGQRYNLATGLPDAQVNHPATSVNGFTLK